MRWILHVSTHFPPRNGHFHTNSLLTTKLNKVSKSCNEKSNTKGSRENIPDYVIASTFQDCWGCCGHMDPHAGNLAPQQSNQTKQLCRLSSLTR